MAYESIYDEADAFEDGNANGDGDGGDNDDEAALLVSGFEPGDENGETGDLVEELPPSYLSRGSRPLALSKERCSLCDGSGKVCAACESHSGGCTCVSYRRGREVKGFEPVNCGECGGTGEVD